MRGMDTVRMYMYPKAGGTALNAVMPYPEAGSAAWNEALDDESAL